MRKQFNLQDWLKDKSQRVETRDGLAVTDIHLTKYRDENVVVYYVGRDMWICGEEGNVNIDKTECKYDLFIVTPEPELSEFEKRIRFTIDEVVDGRYNADNIEDVKGIAKGLLALAREQFIKDGYVIEKKAFHDAFENISDKHLAEMKIQYSIHCKVEDGTRHAVMNWSEFQKVAQKFIDIGKAEALKDLPRWKKIRDNGCIDADGDTYTDCLCLLKRGGYQVMTSGTKVGSESRYLSIRDLEKLPGFKEDE